MGQFSKKIVKVVAYQKMADFKEPEPVVEETPVEAAPAEAAPDEEAVEEKPKKKKKSKAL